jgi:hypothetical protein
VKPLKKLSKEHRRFINWRASYCNPRTKFVKGVSKDRRKEIKK